MTADIHGFKWDRSGYEQVMDSGPVQSVVRDKAESVASACNDDYEPLDWETSPGYVVRGFEGKLTHGYVVRTTNSHAYRSELEHNRLLRNM